MNRESMKVTFTYVGALVGAGFATGQEIMQFFTVFKEKGIIAALVSTILIMLFGMLYLYITYNEQVSSYYDLIVTISNTKIASVFDATISIFLFAGFTIMIAAASSLMYANLLANNYINILLVSIILYMCFLGGIKGILKINSLLIPLLVFIIVLICFKSINLSKDALATGFVPNSYLFSGFTYASYNLIIGMVVLSSLKQEIYNKSTIFLAPFFASVILGGMLFLIITVTSTLSAPTEIPIIDITIPLGRYYYYLLLPCIGIAIITSAVATGHGLIVRLEQKLCISYRSLAVILIMVSAPLSTLGFSNLIKVVYPVFGFINFIIMLLAIRYVINKKIKIVSLK